MSFETINAKKEIRHLTCGEKVVSQQQLMKMKRHIAFFFFRILTNQERIKSPDLKKLGVSHHCSPGQDGGGAQLLRRWNGVAIRIKLDAPMFQGHTPVMTKTPKRFSTSMVSGRFGSRGTAVYDL